MPKHNHLCECGNRVGQNTSGGRFICDSCHAKDNRHGERRHSPTRWRAEPSAVGDFYNYTGGHAFKSNGMTPRHGGFY